MKVKTGEMTPKDKSAGKKKLKEIKDTLVIDALPGIYQGPLKTPKLRSLTFGDIATVGDQLEKFEKQSTKRKDKEWEQKACTACVPKIH